MLKKTTATYGIALASVVYVYISRTYLLSRLQYNSFCWTMGYPCLFTVQLTVILISCPAIRTLTSAQRILQDF